jgi:DNA polymerase
MDGFQGETRMSDESQPTPEELARQVQQHLASLRAAGIEWLPLAPGVTQAIKLSPHTAQAAPAPKPSVQASTPVAVSSLFAESDAPKSSAGAPAMAKSSDAPSLTLDQRRRELQLVAEKVSGCMRCAELASTRTQTVFGVGPLDPELCLIGEAPGADEDAAGEPFVGAAGQLLNRIIAACNMKREEIYICNILKCRPPGNRTPQPNEAANCREYLERQLEMVRPKFICTLGGTAAQYLLGQTQSIGKLRGRFHNYRGIPVICTYHPAYLLPHRSPDKKKDVWEDMKKLMERMGRPVTNNR